MHIVFRVLNFLHNKNTSGVFNLDQTDYALMVNIASHIGKNTITWVKLKTIAREIGFKAVSYVRKRLNQLVEKGLIIKENRSGLESHYQLGQIFNKGDESYPQTAPLESQVVDENQMQNDEGAPLERRGVRLHRGGVTPYIYNNTNNNTLLLDNHTEDVHLTEERQKRSSTMDDDFIYNARHESLALELDVDIREEFEHFRDYHLAKGSRFKDWNRALNTWLRNAAKFKRKGKHGKADGGDFFNWCAKSIRESGQQSGRHDFHEVSGYLPETLDGEFYK